MKPALVLVDLQKDFLAARRIVPAAGLIVEGAARLLAGFRERGLPVIHLWLTVGRNPDNRMPHWKPGEYSAAGGRWICEEGTGGHEPPERLRPVAGERIVHKQFFNGFGPTARGKLEEALGECDTVVLAGVHLHGCVRDTAFGAYERGLKVWIAEDGVGSDDPLHGAIARRYLAKRTVRFAPVARLLAWIDEGSGPEKEGGGGPAGAGCAYEHRAPAALGRVVFRAEPASRALLAEAVAGAGVGQRVIEGIDLRERGRRLRAVAGVLRREREALAAGICEDVGKPIGMARAEVERSALLLEAVAELGERTVMESRSGAERGYRHRPLGVVAAITPWNNPLVIPIGKIAPALMYGNGVVWKPALPGTRVAQRVMALLEEGWAAGARAVRLCAGDAGVARWLAEQQGVEGVTLSGSEQAGYALQEICTDRHVPFQGELGGNNAAIVWEVERNQLAGIAREIALGAFGFAGQRCTANRRVIVAVREVREMVELLASETRKLVWGDPREEGTVVGPVISSEKREQMMALLQRARATGLEVLQPHVDGGLEGRGNKEGAYVAPAIVVSGDAGEEVVQEESFGPVLVVQAAETFEEAIALCNGVRQGLAAALFSQNAERQGQFLAAARAGILKLNQSTVDADACSPFGGWKASGAGPAEHGASDREFFTRVQTIYGKQPEV